MMAEIDSYVSFKTRARAVDMLGRQQIAGIPTAISELFKNAHDAYADSVEADFYRMQRLFILRDDGIGMTYDEFVNNWLTLGTDAKVSNAGYGRSLSIPSGKDPRPILGEKGIGRLAIAAIGPQVLVLTRSAHDRESSELIAALINWTLFQLPGVDLDRVRIPIRRFPPGSAPTRHDLQAMTHSVSRTLDSLRKLSDPEIIDTIERDLAQFEIDENFLSDCNGQSLGRQTQGTQFCINPTYETLELDIDSTGVGDTAPPLLKMLVGFTNTMTPSHQEPVISTAFRYHKSPDSVEDLIESHQFFTPEEFEAADHHISGRFDEYGQFQGIVKVYGKDSVDHVVPWRSARGRPTRCGPFRLDLAVVQGEQRNSRLPNEDWGRIVSKLNRIGGLYIYKDRIRVLPYGSTDYDFLEIEKNRTKSAGYYYFSYRRIFGAVEIERYRNSRLVEKAGREGFRENLAYRQFRGILMNFFVQIAADFFRQGGLHIATFDAQRADLERLELIKRRRDRLVSGRRKQVKDGLEAFFSAVDEGHPQSMVAELLKTLKATLESMPAIEDDNRIE